MRTMPVSYTHLDDKAGLEAALRLKEQYGAEVTVLTMGLPKADEVLREAMAMGADKGILVTDRVLGGACLLYTSRIRAERFLFHRKDLLSYINVSRYFL